LHDRPTAAELVEAVREWLEGAQLDERDRFLRRVASRALGIVERELRLGPELERAHRSRLDALGFPDDTTLARAVRDGLDTPEVVAAIRADVVDKVRVADPRLLDDR
jgi:hypothetical protein